MDPGRIDRLAAANLVRREPDPRDNRGVLVTLTPVGREHLDAWLASVVATMYSSSSNGAPAVVPEVVVGDSGPVAEGMWSRFLATAWR